MNCKKCHEPVPENEQICKKCGQDQSQPVQSTTSALIYLIGAIVTIIIIISFLIKSC